MLLLLAVGALVFTGCTRPAKSEPSEAASSIPHLTTAVVRRGTLRPTLELLGTLEAIPEEVARVDAPSAGWIASVAVVAGDKVEAGAEVLRFDARRRELDVEAARARVREREAALLLLRRGARPEEITTGEAALEEARAKRDSARAELEAARPLAARGELSEVALARLELVRRAAQAAVAARESELALLRAGAREEQIARAEAELEAARSAEASAAFELSLCTVASPIAGTVGDLRVRRGEFVDAGASLVEIEDRNRLFVRFLIPASRLAQVQPGTVVHLHGAGGEGLTTTGKVVRRNPAADPRTGDVEAFAVLHNPDGRWLPGMAASLTVMLPAVENALFIPPAALADRMGTPVVTVVREGRAYEVEVDVGERTATRVQVSTGLDEGTRVILEGGYGLPDGTPVATEPVPSPPSEN